MWVLGAQGAGTPIAAPNYFYEDVGTPLEQEMDHNYPGGVVPIRPEKLVTSRTAAAYDLLPSIAGLLQLERSGAIMRATNQEVGQWRAKAQARYGAQVAQDLIEHQVVYRVMRHINLPAHLCQPFTFMLPGRYYVSNTSCHTNLIGTDGHVYHWAGHYDPEEVTDRR